MYGPYLYGNDNNWDIFTFVENCLLYYWQVSEASETLSGLFNQESRYIYSMYVAFALWPSAIVLTRIEGEV